MVSITHKQTTLRKAVAGAFVDVSKPETIEAVVHKRVPKGDVFEFSRAAGLLAIKKTSDVIPDCHPLPVEFASIQFTVEGLRIGITVEVHTVYKTGVEVEAMHGASIVALVIYDMLKPIDPAVSISSIALVSKSGGKKDRAPLPGNLRTAVIVCSDSISQGQKEDRSGKRMVELLQTFGIASPDYRVISDDPSGIAATLKDCVDAAYDLVLFTGGTGLSRRDHTPEAIRPMISVEIPGIPETARQYGQQHTPTAMLSRGVAGFAGDTLVLTFPGSVRGVEETMEALFPQVLHVFEVRNNKPH